MVCKCSSCTVKALCLSKLMSYKTFFFFFFAETVNTFILYVQLQLIRRMIYVIQLICHELAAYTVNIVIGRT